MSHTTGDATYCQKRGNLFSAVRKRGFTAEAEKEEFLTYALSKKKIETKGRLIFAQIVNCKYYISASDP